MSKISEQKALEEYPFIEGNSIDWGQYEDLNKDTREAYIVGYDQAMQDFLEKAVKFLDEKTVLADCKIEQFKNYMENE